ncbi:unnamed protein product [Closterium sp. Yama58-4]|nr:unnamed protein product [Closterium sp. Yama58-4]
MAFAIAQKLVTLPNSFSAALSRSRSEPFHQNCSPSRVYTHSLIIRCSANESSTSSEGSNESDRSNLTKSFPASNSGSQDSRCPQDLEDSRNPRNFPGAEAGSVADAKQDNSRAIPRRFLLGGATLAGAGILLEGGGDRAGRPLRSNTGRRWSIQGSGNATPLPLPLQPDVDSLPGELSSLLDDKQGLWVSESGSAARLVPVHEGLIAEKRFSEFGPYDVENLYHQEHTCASCFPDCAAGGCLLRITVTYPARMRHTSWTPQYSLQEDKFPLAVFSSGFLLDSAQYRSYAHHLASWGFAVVTYNKVEGLMGPLDDIICARFITELINWAGTSHLLRRIADNTRVYLCGHSRGAKVSVLAAAMDPRVLSLGLVDPVDNTIYAPLAPGYPSAVAAMRAGNSAIEHLLADASPANQGLAVSLPTLVVGGGYPGDCAPAASNYRWFFKEAGNPSWEVVLRDAGHFQFLDSPPVLQAAVCGLGPAKDEDVRRATKACIAAWGHATEIGEDKLIRSEDLRLAVADAVDKAYEKAVREAVQQRTELEEGVREAEQQLYDLLGPDAECLVAPHSLPLQERLDVNLSHLHQLESVSAATFLHAPNMHTWPDAECLVAPHSLPLQERLDVNPSHPHQLESQREEGKGWLAGLVVLAELGRKLVYCSSLHLPLESLKIPANFLPLCSFHFSAAATGGGEGVAVRVAGAGRAEAATHLPALVNFLLLFPHSPHFPPSFLSLSSLLPPNFFSPSSRIPRVQQQEEGKGWLGGLVVLAELRRKFNF